MRMARTFPENEVVGLKLTASAILSKVGFAEDRAIRAFIDVGQRFLVAPYGVSMLEKPAPFKLSKSEGCSYGLRRATTEIARACSSS